MPNVHVCRPLLPEGGIFDGAGRRCAAGLACVNPGSDCIVGGVLRSSCRVASILHCIKTVQSLFCASEPGRACPVSLPQALLPLSKWRSRRRRPEASEHGQQPYQRQRGESDASRHNAPPDRRHSMHVRRPHTALGCRSQRRRTRCRAEDTGKPQCASKPAYSMIWNFLLLTPVVPRCTCARGWLCFAQVKPSGCRHAAKRSAALSV